MSGLLLALATMLALLPPDRDPVPAADPADGSPSSLRASTTVAADSASVLRRARRAQEDFERFRESRIPADFAGRGRGCDEPVGRLCLRFPDGEPEIVLPDPPPVVDARRALLAELAAAAEALPGDRWILGQRLRYLIEAGELREATRLAEECRSEPWWCAALRGWVHHESGRWVEAGEAFLDALFEMPDRERARWTGEEFLLDRDGRRFLDVRDPAERERRRALLWRLADPLFLVPGNDRWTAHMARLTQARVLEGARNAFDLPWDVDLEEILIRYGWALSWERTRSMATGSRGLQPNVMGARLDPDRRRFLPTGEELAGIPGGEDGGLRVRDGRQPSGYAPSYAARFQNLEGQTARFLRGEDLLVVHAFGPEEELIGAAPPDLRSALFLLPLAGPVIEDGPAPVREGNRLHGVWTATAAPGDLILSMEAWSPEAGRAWRARSTLTDLPRPDGPVRVSDPVLMAAEGEPPATLDVALPAVLPTVRVPAGEPVRIGWEVYGLPEGEIATVSLGIERAERSFARRLGEFFRVIDPPAPVVIRWDDAEPETPGTVFRAVDLQLPALDAGIYDLFLEIRAGEAEPAVAQRRFEVAGEGAR